MQIRCANQNDLKSTVWTTFDRNFSVLMENEANNAKYVIAWRSLSVMTGSRFRLRNDLYCVEWGVKLYSLTPWVPFIRDNIDIIELCTYYVVIVMSYYFKIYACSSGS